MVAARSAARRAARVAAGGRIDDQALPRRPVHGRHVERNADAPLRNPERRAADPQVGPIVQAWDGWRRSARDFTWEGTGTWAADDEGKDNTIDITVEGVTWEATVDGGTLTLNVGLGSIVFEK